MDLLVSAQRRVELLDGDAIRNVLPCGFSPQDRDRHVRNVAFLASRLEHHGVTVVVALVSPYREARMFARSLCKRFFEVYLATDLRECQRRDPKGLYAAALAGQVRNVTGVDAPYEPPISPELTLDTATVPVQAAVDLICRRLQAGALRDHGLGTGVNEVGFSYKVGVDDTGQLQ